MATYTNEPLRNISKKDMIPIVLSLQSKLDEAKLEANNKVLEEIRKLNDSFSKLESEFSVTKQGNSLLSSRRANMERQCWANAQYSRRECIDIISIPSEVKADDLEEKVAKIFETLGCSIPPNRIEACHGVSKKCATVIVKFSHIKYCQQVLTMKKDLRKVKMEDVELPGHNKLFINRNLCPYYTVLWSKSKKLHILGKINSFFISCDSIEIKVSENRMPLSITHVNDFGKYFPTLICRHPSVLFK